MSRTYWILYIRIKLTIGETIARVTCTPAARVWIGRRQVLVASSRVKPTTAWILVLHWLKWIVATRAILIERNELLDDNLGGGTLVRRRHPSGWPRLHLIVWLVQAVLSPVLLVLVVATTSYRWIPTWTSIYTLYQYSIFASQRLFL